MFGSFNRLMLLILEHWKDFEKWVCSSESSTQICFLKYTLWNFAENTAAEVNFQVIQGCSGVVIGLSVYGDVSSAQAK